MQDYPVIRLEGVTKAFFTDEVEMHALSGVHLEINAGDFLCISGPSGCGKSTLLSILGLLDSPTDGTYWLHDRPVSELKAGERCRIRNREVGFIFPSFNLIGDLGVTRSFIEDAKSRGYRDLSADDLIRLRTRGFRDRNPM